MRRIPSHIKAMHEEYLRMLAGHRTGRGGMGLTPDQCQQRAAVLSNYMRDEDWLPLADGSLHDNQTAICS